METSGVSAQLEPVSPTRSTFVTVVAWLFIVGAGFATMIATLQAVMFTFVMPEGHFWSDPSPMRGLDKLPPVAQFFLGNIAFFFVAGWLVMGTTLIAAVGLLWWRNWARLYFIALLGLGIAWTLASLWLQYSMMSTVPEFPAKTPPGFESFTTVMLVFTAVYSIGISILFGWMMKRLLSVSIRQEFNAP